MANKGKHVPGAYWTKEDKKRAVTVFKSVGSLAKVRDVTGIPYGSLERWQREEWWKEALLTIRSEDSAELEDAATKIAKQAGEVVQERLQNGDFVFNRNGEIVRKPVTARDAAIIHGISIDKRAKLQEEPQREQQLGTAERLLKLVEQFTQFANAKEVKGMLIKQNAAIDAEIIEDMDAKQPKLQTELQTGVEGRDSKTSGTAS